MKTRTKDGILVGVLLVALTTGFVTGSAYYHDWLYGDWKCMLKNCRDVK